jgi:hypothetical protein
LNGAKPLAEFRKSFRSDGDGCRIPVDTDKKFHVGIEERFGVSACTKSHIHDQSSPPEE